MDINQTSGASPEPERGNILSGIFDGMAVYDSDGKLVGRVEKVYMGTRHSSAQGAAEASPPPEPTEAEAKDFWVSFDTRDQVPDTLKNRLYFEGFLRVDSSRLLARDRYVLPDQIAAVEGDRVTLKVPYKDLTKR